MTFTIGNLLVPKMVLELRESGEYVTLTTNEILFKYPGHLIFSFILCKMNKED